MALRFDFYSPIADTVNNVLLQRTMDKEQQKKVAEALMEWLRVKARKKPVADLEARLLHMHDRVTKMTKNMSVTIVKEKPIVRVSGSDEVTLKMFQLGTSWFDPNPDLTETIFSGLFKE
jgi:hypothetical protein